MAVRSSRCSSGCCLDLAIRRGIRQAASDASRVDGSDPRLVLPPGERLEVLAALLERAVLVVGGAGRARAARRRPAPRRARAAATARSRSPQSWSGTPAARERRVQPLGLLADEVRGAAALAGRRRRAARSPPPSRGRRGSRGRRRRTTGSRRPPRRRSWPWSRRRTARRSTWPTSSRRCADAREARQRGPDRRRLDAAGERDRRRRHRVLEVVRAAQAGSRPTAITRLAAPDEVAALDHDVRRPRVPGVIGEANLIARGRAGRPRSPPGRPRTRPGPGGRRSRSLAARYAANVPWRSRWSGARLSRTAASGANASVSSSWNDDASQTTTAAGSSDAGERASAPCRRCPPPRPGSPPRGGSRRPARSSSSCRSSP